MNTSKLCGKNFVSSRDLNALRCSIINTTSHGYWASILHDRDDSFLTIGILNLKRRIHHNIHHKSMNLNHLNHLGQLNLLVQSNHLSQLNQPNQSNQSNIFASNAYHTTGFLMNDGENLKIEGQLKKKKKSILKSKKLSKIKEAIKAISSNEQIDKIHPVDPELDSNKQWLDIFESNKNLKNIKDTKKTKGLHQLNETNDTMDTEGLRKFKETKENKIINNLNDKKDKRNSNSVNNSKSSKEIKNIKKIGDIINTKDFKYSKDTKSSKDSKNFKDSKDKKFNSYNEKPNFRDRENGTLFHKENKLKSFENKSKKTNQKNEKNLSFSVKEDISSKSSQSNYNLHTSILHENKYDMEAKRSAKNPLDSKIKNENDNNEKDNLENSDSQQVDPLHVKCAVTTYSTNASTLARKLAKQLKIPFQSPEDLHADFVLIVSDKERLILKNTGLIQNYYVDFYQIHHEFCSGIQWKVSTSRTSEYDIKLPGDTMLNNLENMRKPRYKVLRYIFPEDHPKFDQINRGDLSGLKFLDLTGGLSVNAYIYAHAGAHVTIVEKDPVLYALLFEGYKLATTLPGLGDVMKRIKIVHSDPIEYINLKSKSKKVKGNTLENTEEPHKLPWDAILMEPRYYDGISSRQGYYNRNVEEVLKPYVESGLDWNEYSAQVEKLYNLAISTSPVIIKYPVMSTKFIQDGRWTMQKHEAQYIDWVFKRYKDQEYEYQLFLPATDIRSKQSISPVSVSKKKEYLQLKFKEHQRKARKVGGKDILREMEAEKLKKKKEEKKLMIELVDDDTPLSEDELSSLDIEKMRKIVKRETV